MQQEELEALSREAANLLPRDFFTRLTNHIGGSFEGMVTGEAGNQIDGSWLHESTEACTEIMVRVLGDADISIVTSVKGSMALLQQAYDEEIFVPFIPADGDPMLAYRVAVLRALVALSKEK